VTRSLAVRRWFPRGQTLDGDVWESRHRWMSRLLWVQIAVLPLANLALGRSLAHAALETAPLVAVAFAAGTTLVGRRGRETFCSLGLVGVSAMAVHLSGGYVEAHFHFFVMVSLLALYQSWRPFLAALGFVLAHHAVAGLLWPSAVFNHDSAISNPVVWALVHGAFVLAAGLASLATWRINEQQAFVDPLTGLPNRQLLTERLRESCGRGSLGKTVLLYVDLDGFKAVNDTGGHGRGDRVLREVARRLRQHQGDGRLVARLGGDEFALLLTDGDEAAGSALAAELLADFDAPISFGTGQVQVRASIGVAVRDRFTVDGATLLDRADMAMYYAKRAGKARVQVFNDVVHAAIAGRAELEADLRRAVEDGQLVLHYQPIVALEDGSTSGVEALLRWDHPRRGMLPPGEFIAVAEACGAIVPIGAWVLQQACRDAAAWNAAQPAERRYVSVNLSVGQFAADVSGTVRRALEASGLDPADLVLEITESLFVGDVDAEAALAPLRAMGVRVAVDDFGTGWSSLAYLRRLPIDIVKIDRTFVQSGSDGARDEAVLAAVLQLCDAVSLDVVAEGIETPIELSRLRRLGVRSGQGYLYGRPAPLPAEPVARPLTRTPKPEVEVGSPSCGLHLCQPYVDRAEFVAAAVEFLAEGLLRGERLLYVAEVVDAGDLAPLGDVEALLRAGVLATHATRELYAPGASIDPGTQVATYRRLTAEAVADGFAGLRVVADATALVAGTEDRAAFLRYEQLVDEVMRTSPLHALCGYDRRVLAGDLDAFLAAHGGPPGVPEGALGYVAPR
jgi:diguanylate cyclase